VVQKRIDKGDDPQVKEFSSPYYVIMLLPYLKKVCKILAVFFHLGSVAWLFLIVGKNLA